MCCAIPSFATQQCRFRIFIERRVVAGTTLDRDVYGFGFVATATYVTGAV
jgi:hypothetical protein